MIHSFQHGMRLHTYAGKGPLTDPREITDPNGYFCSIYVCLFPIVTKPWLHADRMYVTYNLRTVVVKRMRIRSDEVTQSYKT